MLKFALKSIFIRRVRFLLVAVSIIISAGVALLAYNISCQVNEGIISTAAYYDMIIGPAGSSTQLAMNTMFFTDKPLGTISYDYVRELESSGLTNSVVPFTMGDSYNSARVIGTAPAFLEGRALRNGEMFAAPYEAVVGSAAASAYNISIGDRLITSHGLAESGAAHTASPLIVTGILKTTGTNYDNCIFTSFETVWAIHGHEEETEEHDEEAHEGEVCAILVKSKSFAAYYRLSEYYSKDAHLLCINPSTVLREVLDSVDTSTQIVYLLCLIILAMNILVITVITMLNLQDSKKDISLMRLIGISMKRIAVLYTLENGILGLVSVVCALIMSHACLALLGGYTASMGIVLSTLKIYPAEPAILAVVFAISVLPTLFCALKMASKDGIES